MVDYHVHPYYSMDAEGRIEEYCARAKLSGIDEICFTPHLEIDPVRKRLDDKVRLGNRIVSMKSDWLRVYFKDIESAQKRYPELKLKAGIEMGYEFEIETELKKILNNYPFDFIIGSIHCIDHISITSSSECEECFRNNPPFTLCRKYFILLEALIKSRLFDCIGHLDVYKKYGLKYYGVPLIQEAEPYINKITKLIHSTGIAVEVNTSGLRKEFHEIYPSLSILKRLTNPILTIGSDCHKPIDLGSGIKSGLATLSKLGLHISAISKL